MARNVDKSPKSRKNVEREENQSEKKKIKTKIKQVNSWDRSSSATNESVPDSKRNSDWDQSSDCHETMVEPFDDEKFTGSQIWDSDIDERKMEKINSPKKGGEIKSASRSDINSLDLSSLDVSAVDKTSLFDVFNLTKEKKSENSCLPAENSIDAMEKNEEDSLLVEDIVEFLKERSCPEGTPEGKKRVSERKSVERWEGKESNRTECTPEDDTTIWMIPKSERSSSTDSNGKTLTPSEKKQIEKPHRLIVPAKKAKSSSNVRTREKKSAKSTTSDRPKRSDSKKVNLSNLLMTCEGSDFRTKFVQKKKNGKSCDKSEVYFAEYECRTISVDKDVPKETSAPETATLGTETEAVDDNPGNRNEKEVKNKQDQNYNVVMAGPSNQTSMEVVSLPDIIGRNSMKEKLAKEKVMRKLNGPTKIRADAEAKTQQATAIKKTNESWFLLDETGQYQAVTKDEVMILLNGKSADAVLQTHKEHLIPNSNFSNTTSPNGSFAGVLTKESIQNILREEDRGGEGPEKKQIDLEGKVENTLLYIQPGINLTASIKIIPVDTEMIHLWRRSRDNGSLLSSDVDLRFQSSQDSVENSNQRNAFDHHSFLSRRMNLDHPQQTVAEQDENPAANEPANEKFSPVEKKQENFNPDYSRLLIETRNIVDNLTKSFKLLQNRLDGETNRSMALQGEIKKLRQLLKEPGGMSENENVSREILRSRHQPSNESSYSSISMLQSAEKTLMKNESIIEEPGEEFGNGVEMMASENSEVKLSRNETIEKIRASSDCITVNIYTSDENWFSCNPTGVQETNSLLQTNLGIIERKMKRLEQENDVITKQNSDLKKKLKEISMELEKYLASATDADACSEEDTDTLRDQVCNLKLELDNLKKSARKQEKELKTENDSIQEELERNLIFFEEWFDANQQLMREIENSKCKLRESGIRWGEEFNFEANFHEPKQFLRNFGSFLNRITENLIAAEKNKNFPDGIIGKMKEWRRECTKEMADSNGLILDCGERMEKRRKDDGDSNEKNFPSEERIPDSKEQVMEDYFAIIMEKASLIEEIKFLKMENEMATQIQMEHYEKLKRAIFDLKETKNQITTLKSSQKLSEDEKNKLTDILKIYEEEKIKMEREIEKLSGEKNQLMSELTEKMGKFEDAEGEIKKFKQTFRLKEDLIDELKDKTEQLLRAEEIKENQIEALKEEINDLEMQRNQLDSELTSTKAMVNQSHREMTEYINHLETLVNNTQDALEKNKQKLKETNQVLSRLKTENETLDKQYQCDLKLHSKTKFELEECKDKLLGMSARFRREEEEKEILQEKLQNLINTERRLSEALDSITRQCTLLQSENSMLKERAESFSKDRDDSIKEQKELINKYGIISKELQKLQEKYRYVKVECNERTNVIRHLEMMLKESTVDYNNKIIYLEKNVTHILEKIAACKSTMMENNVGIDSEVQELRRQLDVTFHERKQLENTVTNYYSIIKQMENEIQAREKQVDELNVKLSREKAKECDDREIRNIRENLPENCLKDSKHLRVEQLEKEISVVEKELQECKKKLWENETIHDKEKKKLELTIADLRSDISRYQMRMEVMMKNLTNSSKNLSGLEKKNSDEATKKLREEIEKKEKSLTELKDVVNKCRTEIRTKENELENWKKKNFCLTETLKNLQIQFSKMQNALSMTSKNNEKQQKEKNEVAEKLLQSFKIIMEEKSARQASELVAAEKEKTFKEQLDIVKSELETKTKNYATLSDEFDEKKKLIVKLQHEIKKMKSEVASLKNQVANYKRMKSISIDNENNLIFKNWNKEEFLTMSNSHPQIKIGNFSPERLESCLNELKEAREVNLLLRKSEGQYRSKIVRLEDEIRDARLLIKELEGSIKIEKKSKKAIKNMITSAKMEIDKCLRSRQILSAVADRISRHLDLDSDIQSRKLRLTKRSISPES